MSSEEEPKENAGLSIDRTDPRSTEDTAKLVDAGNTESRAEAVAALATIGQEEPPGQIGTATTGRSSEQDHAKMMAAEMNLRATLEDLERDYHELKHDRDCLHEQLQEAQKSQRGASEANLELQKLNSMVDQLKRDLKNAQSQLKDSEDQTKTVHERADRVQAESDRLREEIRYLFHYELIV